MPTQKHAHLVCGGFPAGDHAGHDMDGARMSILQMLTDNGTLSTTVASDYTGLEQYLRSSKLLVSYTAGPVPSDEQAEALRKWIEGGGKWLCLHGSSGGKADKPLPGEGKDRRIARLGFHNVLGSMFLNHPPQSRFKVRVELGGGASTNLLKNLPSDFMVSDELYMMKMLDDPKDLKVLLTTEITDAEARPNGKSGFRYDEHPALKGYAPEGGRICLGYEKKLGKGGVVYIAIGHRHTPSTNGQPFQYLSANPLGKPNKASEKAGGQGPWGPYVETKLDFPGPWIEPAYQQLMHNCIRWGLEDGAASKL